MGKDYPKGVSFPLWNSILDAYIPTQLLNFHNSILNKLHQYKIENLDSPTRLS